MSDLNRRAIVTYLAFDPNAYAFPNLDPGATVTSDLWRMFDPDAFRLWPNALAVSAMQHDGLANGDNLLIVFTVKAEDAGWRLTNPDDHIPIGWPVHVVIQDPGNLDTLTINGYVSEWQDGVGADIDDVPARRVMPMLIWDRPVRAGQSLSQHYAKPVGSPLPYGFGKVVPVAWTGTIQFYSPLGYPRHSIEWGSYEDVGVAELSLSADEASFNTVPYLRRTWRIRYRSEYVGNQVRIITDDLGDTWIVDSAAETTDGRRRFLELETRRRLD